MFKLFRVRGRSMLPTLGDGDFVIGRRIGPRAVRRLDTRAIVCAQHPHFGPIIKRIAGVDGDTVRLDSDGVTGSESSSFGDVPIDCITHRARLVIRAGGGLRCV
ncbi:MAG: S26 family signal peptidase [Pseudomonadota bacterium]